jgi:hypothetical protein
MTFIFLKVLLLEKQGACHWPFAARRDLGLLRLRKKRLQFHG